MDSKYDVYMGKDRVGTVKLSICGLYCIISCTCDSVGQNIAVLWAETDHGLEKLGLLIPDDFGLGIEKKMPVKKLGQGSIRFFVTERNHAQHEDTVLLDPKCPFTRLRDLTKGRFVRHDKQISILFVCEK